MFGGTISSLERGLNYASTKEKVIAQNIANVDTPNYKAKSVDFKKTFEQVQNTYMQAHRTDYRHQEFKVNETNPAIFSYTNLSYRQNGNGVDMDKEQSNLAVNQIYYHALVDRISGKFNSLQSVIKGGR